jgi:hypothetical protein
MTKMTIDEDKEFLMMQRDGRQGYLGSTDEELAQKETRKFQREQALLQRQIKELKRQRSTATLCSFF